jgi:hypothetical protein
MSGSCKYTWQRCEMHTEFWLEYLKGRDHFKYLGVNEKNILK